MRTLRQLTVVLAMTLMAAAAYAQGEGRLTGKVIDEQGQPIENVAVKATLDPATPPREGKTNKKGEWNLAGLASGQWTVQFSKDGFDTQSGTVNVQGATSQSVTVTLPKHVDRVDPAVELNDAAQQGMALVNQQKYPEARKVFEDLLVKYPTVYQLNAYIAQTYAAENNLDKAVEHMKIAVDHDPENAEMKMVLGDLMMEKGDRPAALEILKTVDVTKIKDPMPLMNAAIVLINDKKTDEALDLLNRIGTQFPTIPETYYYRGRAYIAADKMPEAKADLEKFVSMAKPDSRELPEAKKILDQMKDVK